MEARPAHIVRHRNFQRTGHTRPGEGHRGLATVRSHPSHRDRKGRPAFPQAISHRIPAARQRFERTSEFHEDRSGERRHTWTMSGIIETILVAVVFLAIGIAIAWLHNGDSAND